MVQRKKLRKMWFHVESSLSVTPRQLRDMAPSTGLTLSQEDQPFIQPGKSNHTDKGTLVGQDQFSGGGDSCKSLTKNTQNGCPHFHPVPKFICPSTNLQDLRM